MNRPARATIDLDALSRNYGKLRSLHGGRLLAVLKANAYGHGAVRCATRLRDAADGFAVAFAEEGLSLRAAGIASPILVLEGAFSVPELQRCQSLGMWVVAHHDEQLRMLEGAGLPARSIDVWLKIDSGMHRAGFALEAARPAYARLAACDAVRSIVLMTHFACADDPASGMTARHLRAFDRAAEGLPGARSLCNSAGILAWPAARRDWGRSGIALYGADPLPAPTGLLEPVMQLESAVFAVKEVVAGEPVGYGACFVADRASRVGLVAMGYADGYPRAAGTGTPVLVDGAMARVIGRVSMDMITVDLTELPRSGVGSRVEFWGRGIAINEVAARAGTISYELLCNVKRVRKVYREIREEAAHEDGGGSSMGGCVGHPDVL
jgi:alanine racemase